MSSFSRGGHILASNPGSLSGGGEREPGTHCLRMRKVYGAISSIIRRTLSLPRGRVHVRTRYTKQPKSVKLKDSIFL